MNCDECGAKADYECMLCGAASCDDCGDGEICTECIEDLDT